MAQIKITSQAKKDISGIYNYIHQDSYQHAKAVAEAIIKKIDTLHKQTDAGKIVKEFNDPAIRELKLFKYRIIYRIVTTNVVEIITIQHSARLLNNNPHLKDFFD